MKFTYNFSGSITVEADNQETAYSMAEELIALDMWCYDHCVDCGIYNIELEEVEDDEINKL